MAIMPGANYVNAATSVLMSRYDIVCIHTIVGYAPAHAAHFSTKANGSIIQSRDTKYRSAANLNGNHRIIAIENEDHGAVFGNWNTRDGHAVPGFTAEQIEAIAKILAWAHKTHGIPLVLVPDSKPTSRGIAFHRQGCDGNFSDYDFGGRVSGDELWSTAYGKVCPGDARIHQLISKIIPRARQLVGLDAIADKVRRINYPEDFMYIRCGDDIAILNGPIFIGLGSEGEKADAIDAMTKRGAPYQWVERYTWDAIDARAKAGTVYDTEGVHVKVINPPAK